jgi:predicted Zn-dependent peptidase
MKKYIMKNKIKLIYEYKPGNLTSLCIGLNAGALEEEGYPYGVAHTVEHMVYKGTVNYSENEINNLSDELFGFSNAMTNYPYVIYYGTVSSLNFYKALNLLSDIVINPTFSNNGFKEEMSVIKEELKDWKEDLSQHCEDLLFYNAFSQRRIKDLIIGNEQSVEAITLEAIKSFYNRYYCPENCVVSVVSSIRFEEVIKQVESAMGSWEKAFYGIKKELYEVGVNKTFREYNSNSEGIKLQYSYAIHGLTEEEEYALNLVNLILGDGVSSLLYNSIRTEHGLAYEVSSEVKNERGIKRLNIKVSTSKKNEEKVLKLIDECIDKMKNAIIKKADLEKATVRYKMKQEFLLERSVELSKRMAVYELMYGESKKVFRELEDTEKFEAVNMKELLCKVFKNPSIQVLG